MCVYEGIINATTTISLGSVSNFNDITSINGTLKFSVGFVISLGYMNNDNNKIFEVSVENNGDVICYSPYNDNNSKIKITIEYTTN